MPEVYSYEEEDTCEPTDQEPIIYEDRGDPVQDLGAQRGKAGTVSRTSSSFLVNRGHSTSLVTATSLSVFRWRGGDFGAPGPKDATLRQLKVQHYPSDSLTSFQHIAYPGSMSRLHDLGEYPQQVMTSIRDQFSDLQDVDRRKEDTFLDLLLELVYKVWLTIYAVFGVIFALVPILAVFIHAARFLVDKFIELLSPQNSWLGLFQLTLIFLMEVTVVFGCLYGLATLVFFPIYIMTYAFWRRFFFFLF